MSVFLDDHYLLGSEHARELFQEIAGLPIIDPHNHADVREIAENANYSDIWQVEASTDHYVWAALRKAGVAEQFITGPADSREKWSTAAEVWDLLAGNPTYEWVYLDLKRLLGIEEHISADTAGAIWERARTALQRPDMTPQALLKKMNVEAMCSTDDPIDRLEYHQQLAEFDVKILPTFRPDRAMNIFLPDWRDYIGLLEKRVNERFTSIADLVAALRITHDYFAANGCIASDHGLEIAYAYEVAAEDADAVFRKAMDGKALTASEVRAYMSYLLNQVAELDAEKDWVFQLHVGAVRNVRNALFDNIGPDSGGDISSHHQPLVAPLRDLLNRFDDRLKTVLYCLDPGHQATLATLARAFGTKVRLGAAWWFNDTPVGMKRQLEYIGGVDLLSSFGGMVSDSRKLLSYASRHEMFRRVLSDVLGDMVARGRMPHVAASGLARRMAYDNSKSFFGL